MPSIDDIVQVKKPFKKKAYRPWNLLDETAINSADTKLDGKSSPDFISEPKTMPEHQKTTGNNKRTISKQIDNSLVNKQKNNKETIRNPLVNDTKRILSDKKTIGKQIDNVLVNALVNDSHKKPEGENNLTESVKRLTGHQRKLLIFIVEDCLSHGLLTTNFITNESLRILINTNTDSIKTSIQRLIQKKLITREKGKRGNGGFTCYKITKSVRDAVLQEKQKILISAQLGNALDNALVNNSVTDKVTIPPSSSSFKDLNTTTEEQTSVEIFGWIKEIDIECLQGIGFSNHHLSQIASQKKLAPEVIQQSINAFAFDLTENNKAKSITGNPLNFFMGILRKGIPYLPPANYESPEERAMRLFSEGHEKRRTERKNAENKAFNLAAEEWFSDLTEDEKNNIISQQNEQNDWLNCFKYLQEEQEKQIVDTWIKPLSPVRENGKWVLYAPNHFVKEEASKRFSPIFETFLGKFTIEVGHANSFEQDNSNEYSPEMIEFRKYFKNHFWEAKRKEILGI